MHAYGGGSAAGGALGGFGVERGGSDRKRRNITQIPFSFFLLASVTFFFLGQLSARRFPDPEDELASLLAAQGQARDSANAEFEQQFKTESYTTPKQRNPAQPYGKTGISDTEDIPYQVLSWYPRALHFPNFAPLDRCARIKQLASKRLTPSTVALRNTDTKAKTKGVRTSTGTFIPRDDDPFRDLAWLEDKIARATHTPVSHGEPFNVLRYELGQKYDAHYDTFEEEGYGPQLSQRMISFLVYLTDVEEGGETIFPVEGRGNLTRLKGLDYQSCAVGLKVKPSAGDALMFYNMMPNGTIDQYSLHAGCPVTRGEKWVATKWLRDQPFIRAIAP